jgi:hypothetical protein
MRDDILVTGGSDGSVRVWSLSEFKAIHRLAAHDNSVTSLQFDDTRIVSGGSDGRVKVWDLKKGTHVRDLCQPADAVWRVVFEEEKAVIMANRGGKTVMEVWSFSPPDEEFEEFSLSGSMAGWRAGSPVSMPDQGMITSGPGSASGHDHGMGLSEEIKAEGEDQEWSETKKKETNAMNEMIIAESERVFEEAQRKYQEEREVWERRAGESSSSGLFGIPKKPIRKMEKTQVEDEERTERRESMEVDNGDDVPMMDAPAPLVTNVPTAASVMSPSVGESNSHESMETDEIPRFSGIVRAPQ